MSIDTPDYHLDIVYYVAASLDGFVATAEGSTAWLAPFEAFGEDYGYAEFYASVDGVLLGRKTYEQTATFAEWPFRGKPVWVLTSRAPRTMKPEVTFTTQTPLDLATELCSAGHRRLWLVGGGSLAAAFRSARLITEYVVSIIPIVLGSGIPLFAGAGSMEALHLAGTTSYPNGLVQLRYFPERMA